MATFTVDARNLSDVGDMLQNRDGRLSGQSFAVGMPNFDIKIGRDVDPASGHVQLDKGVISRDHAKIFLKEQTLHLQNLSVNSTTRVNGRKLKLNECVALNAGDDLAFADVEARIVNAQG